jgi:hypothetical protein
LPEVSEAVIEVVPEGEVVRFWDNCRETFTRVFYVTNLCMSGKADWVIVVMYFGTG